MSKPDPVDCDPQSDLENALTQIFGVAEVLKAVGVKDEVASYLGGQLEEHYDAALDAFRRIFKLDGVQDGRGDPRCRSSGAPCARKCTATPRGGR